MHYTDPSAKRPTHVLIKLVVFWLLLACLLGSRSYAAGTQFHFHNHCHTHTHKHGYFKGSRTHSHKHCHRHWHPSRNPQHSHKRMNGKLHTKKWVRKNHHADSR